MSTTRTPFCCFKIEGGLIHFSPRFGEGLFCAILFMKRSIARSIRKNIQAAARVQIFSVWSKELVNESCLSYSQIKDRHLIGQFDVRPRPYWTSNTIIDISLQELLGYWEKCSIYLDKDRR